jgi:hypothetical protein
MKSKGSEDEEKKKLKSREMFYTVLRCTAPSRSESKSNKHRANIKLQVHIKHQVQPKLQVQIIVQVEVKYRCELNIAWPD